MFILLDSRLFIILEKLEFIRLYKKTTNYTLVIININMWFISRCISVDSLNSCFQQQKNKTSYDFSLCKERTEMLGRR